MLLLKNINQKIEVLNLESWRLVHIFTGHSAAIRSISLSLDGKLLASGSYDNSIKIWDVASGKHLDLFIGHSESVNSVIFSPDGKMLASASNDTTIRLWNL